MAHQRVGLRQCEIAVDLGRCTDDNGERDGEGLAAAEQIRHVLDPILSETDSRSRDRAMSDLTVFSGARDNAIASLSDKHVDTTRRLVHRDAREVRNKCAKTLTGRSFRSAAISK